MSYRTTAILLAILVVIGIAVYWQDLRPEAKKEGPKETQIFSFETKDVNRIEVTYQGKTTELRKLRRENDTKWRLTKPEEAEADYWYMEGLASRLGKMNANRALTDTGSNLSEFGLDRPDAMVVIDLATEGGKQQSLLIGDKSPDGSAYYVKRSDSDTVYLVNSSLVGDIIKVTTDPPKATPTPTPAPAVTPAPEATPSS